MEVIFPLKTYNNTLIKIKNAHLKKVKELNIELKNQPENFHCRLALTKSDILLLLVFHEIRCKTICHFPWKPGFFGPGTFGFFYHGHFGLFRLCLFCLFFCLSFCHFFSHLPQCLFRHCLFCHFSFRHSFCRFLYRLCLSLFLLLTFRPFLRGRIGLFRLGIFRFFGLAAVERERESETNIFCHFVKYIKCLIVFGEVVAPVNNIMLLA